MKPKCNKCQSERLIVIEEGTFTRGFEFGETGLQPDSWDNFHEKTKHVFIYCRNCKKKMKQETFEKHYGKLNDDEYWQKQLDNTPSKFG